jgi:hypothetical protein
MGAPAQDPDRGVGDQAHAPQAGDAVARLLHYRGDYLKLDEGEWHCFTGSQYDSKSGQWQMSKLPVHRIVEGFELLQT